MDQIEKNPSKEELEKMKSEIESKLSPIMVKVYQANQSAPKPSEEKVDDLD